MTKWISLQEAAERISLHPATIRRYIEDGELKAYKLKRVWRISEASLHSFMEAREVKK